MPTHYSTIPGADLYRMGPQIMPGQPVYRPEMQTGLLPDDETRQLMQNFAGGLLNGFQVRPPTGDLRKYGMQQQQAGLLGGAPGQMQPASHAHPQANPLAQMGLQVTPINPSGVYDMTPNPNATGGGDDASPFAGMTTGDMLRMLYADELASDPGSIGTNPIHNMLGGQHGLTQLGTPYALAQKQHGVDLDAAMNPDDVKKIQGLLGRKGSAR
jgi:hypothetical protein